MYNYILKNNEDNMKKCLDIFKNKINTLYISRISPHLLDKINIKISNKFILIKYIASIVVENSNTLKITPFDILILKKIEKAILSANLNLSIKLITSNNIYVIIPPLTETRRINMIKIIKEETEQNRINIRNIRRDSNNKIKFYLKEKKISKNEEKKLYKDIQKQTTYYIKYISDIFKKKEKELLNFK
ncbi:ribosome recycling factor [Enterobacteriaceae endosymbiont of Plateumaris consimilis]|uniref:ribosome-recycling factor n=1 Tax=Enterobacteriaceae endosymbiont of Plateumaris consimilis TaxID=2675794 RepID=UPI0014490199|nr:ribosome recycling factor [Enterobacteriaceae endosymbiont of Plateumaris consimilis]QJC28641.1 ribosome recycling factor [Enterobacteriaceae endosymbiont of Plateumaris consimilis]